MKLKAKSMRRCSFAWWKRNLKQRQKEANEKRDGEGNENQFPEGHTVFGLGPFNKNKSCFSASGISSE